MITPPRPPARNVGRFTGLVLALVVFICVTMIGVAGYLKYRLDRAEATLAASPEAALSGSEEPYDRLRRNLGYGGFLSLAQTFSSSHDPALIPDMKTQIKAADDIVAHLPERTPTEIRRDLISIGSTFDNAMQKADKSATDPSITFSTPDLVPLYAAMPVLDDRVASASAVGRLAVQNQLQFWAMLLTFVCWASLIIAAAMSVGIYLSLRDRNSAPLRALAQSVKNMSHGDMSTSIWGMERSDMIGELARAIDLARYHFSQLPDMTLLSDQGPVRIRFEGAAKSLFEAMMQLMTRDSEQVRHQANALSDAISKQQMALSQMSAQVETVMHNILQRGHTGEQQVKQVLNDILGSARSLKNAQEHAADQLNRIVPYLQERAHGMAEITQITGKQVAQALQSLTLSERGLKASADQSENAIKKLAGNADELGDRLFGAINLLQASGKVLAETTETVRGRLNEIIQHISSGGQMPPSAPITETFDISRLEALVVSLEEAQKQLQEVVREQTQAAKAQIDLLTTNSTSLLAQSTSTAQTLSTAADHLRDEQAKLDRTISAASDKLDTIGDKLQQQAAEAVGKALMSIPAPVAAPVTHDDQQLAEITTQIQIMSDKLSALTYVRPATGDGVPSLSYDTGLLTEIRAGFETTVRSLSNMREQLTNMVINVQAQAPLSAVPSSLPSDDRILTVAAQIDATRNNLAQLIAQQTERLEARLSSLNAKPIQTAALALPQDAQDQMEQQTQILTELVATLGVLDAHMQEIRSQVSEIKGQKAG